MKDLFFMNDGNPTMIANEMVNFQKFRTINARIMALRVSQQSKYDLTIADGTPSRAAHGCPAVRVAQGSAARAGAPVRRCGGVLQITVHFARTSTPRTRRC